MLGSHSFVCQVRFAYLPEVRPAVGLAEQLPVRRGVEGSRRSSLSGGLYGMLITFACPHNLAVDAPSTYYMSWCISSKRCMRSSLMVIVRLQACLHIGIVQATVRTGGRPNSVVRLLLLRCGSGPGHPPSGAGTSRRTTASVRSAPAWRTWVPGCCR